MNAECLDTESPQAIGPAFPVLLRSRRFRTSPKIFTFFQIGIEGKILRFHPCGALPGKHEFRIDTGSQLAYLTDPDSDRTWAFTLGPFSKARRARSAGRDVAAVAIAAAYESMDVASRSAPRLVTLAKWLKSHREGMSPPAIDELPFEVELSGRVVAGLHLIDNATGRQLVTIRSQSLEPGKATLQIQADALRLSQGGDTVYFPVRDLIQRWGSQLTRSAIYTSSEDARRRAAELQTHRDLGRLASQALSVGTEPDAALLASIDHFEREAAPTCSDHRGSIGIALTLPRKLGGTRRIGFRLPEFGPHHQFSPALSWIPHQGLLALWSSGTGRVIAFGVGHLGARRFGVFASIQAARTAAAMHLATLVDEAFVQRRDHDLRSDLRARIAAFNSTRQTVKADNSHVPLPNVFTGRKRRFRTNTTRGRWIPKLLLTPAGPVLVLFSESRLRDPDWLAFGPLRDQRANEVLEPIARGRGQMSLEALADLLKKELGVRVDAVDREAEIESNIEQLRSILRDTISEGQLRLNRSDRESQARLFHDFAEILMRGLHSGDVRLKREAILAAEYFFFGRPCEQLLNLHSPLVKNDPVAWTVFLGEGGRADVRSKEITRSLSEILMERHATGLTVTARPRLVRFLDLIDQIMPRNAKAETTEFPCEDSDESLDKGDPRRTQDMAGARERTISHASFDANKRNSKHNSMSTA